MKTIKASAIVSAQVLNVDYSDKQNSYVVTCVSKQQDGGYSVHAPIWTNSSQQPVFTSGMSVNLVPETYKTKTNKQATKFHILPA